MEQTLVEKLIEFVENASPVIWEAMYRQVYINAIYQGLAGAVLVCLAVVFFTVFKRTYKKDGFDNDAACVAIILSVASAIVGAAFLVSVIGPMVNPNYYAIDNLLDLVKGGVL